MLQIIVTGKPSKLTKVEKKEGSTTAGMFILTEKRYIQKALYAIDWHVCVPTWKMDWVEKAVEKGYTVAVIGSDFASVPDPDAPLSKAKLYLMLDEINML